MANPLTVTIVNQAVGDDFATTYAFPTDTISVAFRAREGWIRMATVAGGTPYWHIAEGDREEIGGRALSGVTLYLDAETATDVLEMRIISGP